MEAYAFSKRAAAARERDTESAFHQIGGMHSGDDEERWEEEREREKGSPRMRTWRVSRTKSFSGTGTPSASSASSSSSCSIARPEPSVRALACCSLRLRSAWKPSRVLPR